MRVSLISELERCGGYREPTDEDRVYEFCSEACKAAFEAEPRAYL